MRDGRPPLVFAASAVAIAAILAFDSGRLRGQSAPPSASKREITPAQAREQVDQIAKDLREARSLASQVSDKATRDKLTSILAQAELRARDLSDDLGQAKLHQGPVPLTDAEFDKLIAGVNKETFDPGKLAFILK